MPPVTPISGLPTRTVEAAKDSSDQRQDADSRRRSKDKSKTGDDDSKFKAGSSPELEENREVVEVSQPIDSLTLVQLLPTALKLPSRTLLYRQKPQCPDNVKELPRPMKLNKAV